MTVLLAKGHFDQMHHQHLLYYHYRHHQWWFTIIITIIKSTIRMITSWWEKEASSTPLAASSLSPGWSRPSERAGSFTKACKSKLRNLYFPENDDKEPSAGCFTKFWLRIFGLCVRHIYSWVVDLYCIGSLCTDVWPKLRTCRIRLHTFVRCPPSICWTRLNHHTLHNLSTNLLLWQRQECTVSA